MKWGRALASVAIAGCAHGSEGNPDAPGSGVHDSGPVGPDAQFCGTLPCDAVYVATTGNDGNAGTKMSPVKTITAGVHKAGLANPKLAVFVMAGVYNEAVAMEPGVGVYGGFDQSWTRTSVTTEINGPSPAVTFDQIHTGTLLDTITVRSADATSAGDSSYAIVITSS